jgi:hypothetical protein
MHADRLRRLLLKKKIATMPELKAALGTAVDLTVFRKLRELSYRSSYSHRGKYYTLDEIARFDALGLWSFRAVWFSKHGTLVRTCAALVSAAEAGFAADELAHVLHVEVKDALRKLAQEGRIFRAPVSGRLVHFAADPAVRQAQLRVRQGWDAQPGALSVGVGVRAVPDELKAAIILFFSVLDEQQRRLYAGLESLTLGHGGDRTIADLLGLDPGTVAKGRQQLLSRDVKMDRVRKPGGGRRPLEKKRRRSSRGSRS